MIAKINSDGLLSVVATTETEAYALRQWWKSYQEKDGQSSLMIVTSTPEVIKKESFKIVDEDRAGYTPF